jgi:hypothetical protein
MEAFCAAYKLLEEAELRELEWRSLRSEPTAVATLPDTRRAQAALRIAEKQDLYYDLKCVRYREPHLMMAFITASTETDAEQKAMCAVALDMDIVMAATEARLRITCARDGTYSTEAMDMAFGTLQDEDVLGAIARLNLGFSDYMGRALAGCIVLPPEKESRPDAFPWMFLHGILRRKRGLLTEVEAEHVCNSKMLSS